MSWPDLRRALRRSRIRCEILLCLLVLRAAGRMDLARRTGADPANLYGALHGERERYRYDHALVTLGLVDATMQDGELVYTLTTAGREIALELRRDVLSAWSRPAGARS